MTAQSERSLQGEVMLRIRAGAWPILALPIPNGIWIPAHDEEEKRIIARIIARMKADGLLLPGAFDLSLHWRGGGGIMDLKRAAGRDLLGKRTPAGRPTKEQNELAEKAKRYGINYAFPQSWDEVHALLREWGAPIPLRLADMVRGLPNTTLDDMIDAEAAQ